MQLLKQSKHEMGFKEASLRVTDTLRDNAVQLHVRGSNALGSSLSLTVRLNEETISAVHSFRGFRPEWLGSCPQVST